MAVAKIVKIDVIKAGTWVYFLDGANPTLGFVGEWEANKSPFLVKLTPTTATWVQARSGWQMYPLFQVDIEPVFSTFKSGNSVLPGSLVTTEAGALLCFSVDAGEKGYVDLETGIASQRLF
ncbi:MAG: hypothetical protein ACLP8A_03210 [Methylovirgula sp.]